MCKKILRILSLALAILLVANVMLPASVTAAATTADEIKQQIKRTYKKACSHYGWDSFDGYCGSFISAQLFLLGITDGLVHGDGNDQYDAYCRQTRTSGGYQVRAYSAKTYSLREALNDITKYGTRDAYNILVGFQETKSEAGKLYGHACVIYAILDGTVYFVESYEVKLNGKTYAEGSPISCSIEDFCQYYAKTTTKLDGVIYFGLRTYAEQCETYPASSYAAALVAGELRTAPCDSDVDDSSEVIRTLTPGEQLTVIGLYLNTEGEYWYQVDGEQPGYVRAEQAQIRQLLFDDVNVVDAYAPTVQRQGRSFKVKGTILSEMNSIFTVRAQVYSLDSADTAPVISATDVVEGKDYTLADSAISKKLTFRKLPVGNYRYELAAIVGNHYVENGQIQIGWDTVALWSSDFQVVEEKTNSDTVTFDACGGTASLNQTAVTVGQAIGTLPTAQRTGYVFLGWYTEAEGGLRVTTDYMPDGNVTLYAHWSSIEALQASWQNADGCWYFYSDGLSSMGCIEVDGTLYYFSAVDSLGQNLTMWTATGTV